MRSRNWQPSSSLTAVLRRVIEREKAAGERRRRQAAQADGFETLESRLMMSAVHSALPIVPSAVTAAVQSPTAIQLHWTNKDTSVSGYYVLRSVAGGSFTSIGQTKSKSATTFTDNTLAPNTTVSYQIEAHNNSGTSLGATSAVVITSLLTPGAPTVSAQSGSTAQLTWKANNPTAGGYYILRSSDGTHFSQIATVNSGATTSYADSTLTSGHKFSYEVQAFAGSNKSAVSKATSVITPLAAPSRLSATAKSSTSVLLGWADNDPSAAGYYVLRSTDGAHYSQISKIASPGAISFTDKTASPLKKFYYKIEAYSAAITSPATSPASASTPLTVPTGAKVSALSSSSVKLTWTDTDKSALGYYILRASDGSHFRQIDKLSSGKTSSYVDSTVTSNSVFQYEVESYSGTNTSLASNIASLTTPLVAPSSLTAIAQSRTSVQLSWTDNDPAATGYNVLRANDGVHFAALATVNSESADTFVDSTAVSGHVYSYQVIATTSNNTSSPSSSAAVTTPLAAPSGLNATAPASTTIILGWTDNDSSASGYNILRSSDGTHFSQIAQLTSGSIASFTDTVASNSTFQYEVEAISGNTISAPSNVAITTTPLNAPTALTATAASTANTQLHWTDNDPNAAGYAILRAIDGVHFSQIGTITSASATTYSDVTVSSGHAYTYGVRAFAGSATSTASNSAAVTTPLAAPSSLTANAANGSSILLGWTDNDSSAAGYNVLRSSDGMHFTQLATVSTGTAGSYVDGTAVSAQKYYYQVQAFDAVISSAVSNTASATAGGGVNSVSITTRYGNELVITSIGASDTLSLSQSGTTLTVIADGQTFTDPIPAAGIFVYTRGGADGITISQTVTARATIETIDGAITDITSAATNVSAWIDSTDVFTGSGVVHAVASFAGGVSKALGASLIDPTDSGPVTHISSSLWGTGPVAGDINQGSAGDCYFLSSLAGFAGEKPSVLTESAVDMGDGTYVVQFYSSGRPVDVRVSNDVPSGGFGGFKYAHPGASDAAWGLVMEKAFAYFRTGANTYASIDSGWMGEVYSDFNVNSTNFFPTNYSESAFYNLVSTELANHKTVTFGTSNAPDLVSGHAYTLISATIDSNGVTHYLVRNPWGIAGDSLENSQGYATLTFAQVQANFIDGCQAA